MTLEPQQPGIVVVMDKTVVTGLLKLASRHGWTLIQLPSAAQVIQSIGRDRVDIAVIHIAVDPQQSVDLIRWLRATRRNVLLVAVASGHREEIERLVRQAGAHCYLPQSDEITLERAIMDLLEHQTLNFRPSLGQRNHTHAPTAGGSPRGISAGQRA